MTLAMCPVCTSSTCRPQAHGWLGVRDNHGRLGLMSRHFLHIWGRNDLSAPDICHLHPRWLASVQ